MKEATAAAFSAIHRTSPLEIMKYLRIKAVGGVIDVMGSDGVVGVEATESYSGEDISACVPAEKFASIVSSMDSPTILRAKNGIVLKSGKSRITIPTRDFRDHPGIAENSAEVEMEDCTDLIKHTSYAAAKDDARAYFNGVYLKQENGKCIAVATDGHRFAISRKDSKKDGFADGIIPSSAAKHIQSKAWTEMVMGDRSIVTSNQSQRMSVRLIEHKYPDPSRLLRACENEMLLRSDELMKAATLCLRTANDQRLAFAKMEWANGSMSISSYTKEIDTLSEIQVVATSPDASSGSFSLNPAYIIDMLKRMPGHEEISIQWSGNDPSMVRIDFEDQTHLIATMKK